LRSFGQLLPVARVPGRSRITLEDHLAGFLAMVASDAYAKSDPKKPPDAIAISLISIAGEADRHPCVAISHLASPRAAAIGFAPPAWRTPLASVADYVAGLDGPGMIRERHITRRAIERIARSL
jgi:hypothetical protein